ncbi:MAG: radical SAM protein [Treponema sp.]|nr:radical SAM protein [Treponema sp.]
MKYILDRSGKVGAGIYIAVVFDHDSFKQVRNRFYSQKISYNYPAMIVVNDKMRFLGIFTEKDIISIEKRNDIDLSSIHAIDVCNIYSKYISLTELEVHKKNNTDPFEGLPPSISFMPVVDDNKCFINFVYNINFYNDNSIFFCLDINDSCQLQCPYCPRGTKEIKNTKKEMDLTTFKEVIKKSKEYKVTNIDIGNWTEPFLKKDLYKYMEILRDYDIPVRGVTSNLSFPKIYNFEQFLESGFTKLTVSVSGNTQKIYEKYHKGGNIEYVKRNLDYASNYIYKNNIDGNIFIRFLDFGYNRNEINIFEEYAYKSGFLFEHFGGLKDFFTDKSFNNINRIYGSFNVCFLFRFFALDCSSNVYLCICRKINELHKVGNFLEDSYEDLMLNKFMNPVCQFCNWDKTFPLPEKVKRDFIKRINEQTVFDEK